MQNMSDTHDHGPPNNITQQAKSATHNSTPYPRLARWTTSLSSSGVNSFSGAMAGVASGIVTCPLDVIKTKLQAQGSFRNPALKGGTSGSAIYHGLIGTARTIVRQDGLKGMYRGLGTMLLGYLPTWAVYMTVYDKSKDYFARNGYNDTEIGLWMSRTGAAVAAGTCSTLATNPIWVIKTRLMSQSSHLASENVRTPWQYNSTLDAFRKMYRAEGLGVFYSGLGPALLGLSHVAIQFPLYEYFKQRFTGLEMGETPQAHGKAAENTFGILAATLISKVAATSMTYPHEVLRTRLQTQQRHIHPEGGHDGITSAHHSQQISSKRIGNTDGGIYRPRYVGILRTAQVIYREEGWRAFYSGMGTNMLRAVPAAMTTMLTFESLKSAIGRMQEEGRELEERDRL
jgi:solute carrier family 25 folate transporter 32